MIRIIATDEAGYGPRLGPLVITATLWDIDEQELTQPTDFQSIWEPFVDGFLLSDNTRLHVGDSKQLFKRSQAQGLDGLEKGVSVFTQIHSTDPAIKTLEELLRELCERDYQDIARQPWNQSLRVAFPLNPQIGHSVARWSQDVREQLAIAGIRRVKVGARVLEVEPFNALCQAKGNKATVLSETTMELVRSIMENLSPVAQTLVFSDRHGGRLRYAPLLQQFFPNTFPQIVAETAQESRYRLACDEGQTIDWRFTVKGDRFLPVGLASMFAKYFRERLMDQFNAYWRREHDNGLVSTAGYPEDANRFLKEIAPTVQRLGVLPRQLVRDR